MQEIKTEARTLGANFLNDGSVSVVVWAPNAEKVEVVMHETIALEKKEFGYWETVIAKIEEGTKYKIRVDNNEPFPDPVSLSQPDGVHGQSAVVDVGAFNADSNGWKNL